MEFQDAAGSDRLKLERRALEACAGLTLLEPASFTHGPEEQACFWKIRQGALPTIGAVRARGTSVITEDLVFPLAD